jgi:hypothetical protein
MKNGEEDQLVGLHCVNRKIDGWSNLDGHVSNSTGWWASRTEMDRYLEPAVSRYVIASGVTFRGVPLQGKPCKLVAASSDGIVFMEFDEDLGGCSADGHGKSGRCVPLLEGCYKPIKEDTTKKKAKVATKKAKEVAKGKI